MNKNKKIKVLLFTIVLLGVLSLLLDSLAIHGIGFLNKVSYADFTEMPMGFLIAYMFYVIVPDRISIMCGIFIIISFVVILFWEYAYWHPPNYILNFIGSL